MENRNQALDGLTGITLAQKVTSMRKYLKALFLENQSELEFEDWMYLLPFSEHSQLDQTLYSQIIGRDKTITAKLIKRYEEEGLLKRSINSKDARQRIITFTAKGKRLHAKFANIVIEADLHFTSGLTRAEIGQLHYLLSKIQN